MIQLVDLSKTFHKNNVQALKDINLTIHSGEIFGFLGKSGAGKSTLIRMINGLEHPSEGTLYINNQNLSLLSKKDLIELRRTIGMIFQGFNLIQSKTVYKNIAFPLEITGVSKETIDARVKEVLALVELSDKLNAYPNQLSGGQKQRVAIARSIINHPKILLCDEATSALDPKTTQSILKLLKKINQTLGITIVLITHELSVVQKICHRVGILDNGYLVDYGLTHKLFNTKHIHPVTQELLEVETCII